MSKNIVKTDIRLARSTDAFEWLNPDEQRFSKKAIAEGHCFAALRDGRPVGYATLDYTFYGNGFVGALIVEASHRRMGIGSSLMARLESECRKAKLFTSTNLSNLAMQSLLAKRGYTLTGVIDNLDPDDPELVYFKPVGEAVS